MGENVEEIVDVTYEQGRVLYSTEKSGAHSKGLLHATANAVLFNDDGRFVLVKQAGHKQDAGLWVDPIGGHVSSGEDIDTALKRETFEEMGLTNFTYISKGGFIFNRFVINRQENHYFHCYEVHSNEEPKLNDEAVSYK